MAAVESQMITLGSDATRFTLANQTPNQEAMVSLEDMVGENGIVIAFICNHCPYVLHIESKFSELTKNWSAKGVNTIAISANDIEHYPADAPDKMTEFAKRNNFDFPYLYDEDQSIAKAYQAACTPDFYLYDKDLKLVYRGQFDASRPKNDVAVTGDDLNKAVVALASGHAIDEQQIPSIGCNIKWLAGNEPEYFAVKK